MHKLPGCYAGKALAICRKKISGKRKDLLSGPQIRSSIDGVIDTGNFSDIVDDIHHSNLSAACFNLRDRHV